MKGGMGVISFKGFEPTGSSPIYLQIIKHIKVSAVSGDAAIGDELPSRRSLSAMLGINPNTVQKAYRLLEDEGIISTVPGAKSILDISPEKLASIKIELLQSTALSAVKSMIEMHITKDDAFRVMEELWDKEEKGESK